MAAEKKIWEIIRDAGFEPLEDCCIVVKYAPENMSARIADFFSMEFYVLQLCREELVLIPFSQWSAGLQQEIALRIPYSEIQSVAVEPDAFNDRIVITMAGGVIRLTAQQKELSSFRTSGALAGGFDLSASNWHSENYDRTMGRLKELAK